MLLTKFTLHDFWLTGEDGFISAWNLRVVIEKYLQQNMIKLLEERERGGDFPLPLSHVSGEPLSSSTSSFITQSHHVISGEDLNTKLKEREREDDMIRGKLLEVNCVESSLFQQYMYIFWNEEG